jgi:ATP-dependent Clp protease ATP-binding subunit ClpC
MVGQLPPEAKKLEEELQLLLRSKDKARRSRDYEKAEDLKIQEYEVKARLNAYIMANEKTEAEKRADSKAVVLAEDVAEVVAAWTGIPISKLTVSESEKLLQMEETLHTRIIGQDEAVIAVSRAIRRSRVGLRNPERPIASFIFAGPTVVGKTELTKALSIYFFGSENAQIRLVMSEYMERHTVSKLIGSPPGYVGYQEGGQLTEAVRRKPYSIVLFDEIEKAHPDIFNLMLQIFDDGRLTDAQGRTVNFCNTLLVMTSNVGSKVIERGIDAVGFEAVGTLYQPLINRIKGLVKEELKLYFRPEFLNRLDDIIVFRQLNKVEVGDIAEIMLKDVANRIAKKGIHFDATDRFKKRLVDEGYNPSYGARPLRRAVQNLIENDMAEQILLGKINSGDVAIADVRYDDKCQILLGKKLAPPSDFEEVKRSGFKLFKDSKDDKDDDEEIPLG